MSLRLKYVFILLSAALLCWTIAFQAVAQTGGADSSLYDQYGAETTTHKQVRRRAPVKAHSRFIKKKRIRRKALRRRAHYYRGRSRRIRRQLLRRRGAVSQRKTSRVIRKRYARVNPPSVFYPYRRNVQPVRHLKLVAENQPANQMSDQNVADVGELNGLDNDNAISPMTNLETKIPDEVQAKPPKYNGRVDFLVGHDSNLDPNRSGVQDEYYQIDPSLGFEGEHWSGNVQAMMLDYENQQISTDNKKEDAQGTVAYKTDLTQSVKSTSTFFAEYHDEAWPDYINGPEIAGLDGGMPLRYTLAKLDQKLDYNLGDGFTATTGANAEHSESSELYTDWSVNVLNQDRFRPSFNQYEAYGEVAFQAAPWVQFALDPSITDQKFTERLAYGPDGAPIGTPTTSGLSSSLFEMVTSELDFNTNLKFGDTTLTPTLQVGQANDTVFGGNTNTYYGGGLNGKIMLNKDANFYVKPSVMFTQTNYANFNYMLAPGVYRQDSLVVAGLEADANITKTVGWVATFMHTRNLSNVDWSFINYNEDVVDTGIFFAF